MREIKFRAWDKRKKKIIDVAKIQFYRNGNGNLSNCIASIQSLEKSYLPADIILLQFTGLLDKNGKEIYEGDIIKYTDAEGKIFNKYIVFRNGCFEADSGEWHLKPLEKEIIGNVYENKELLK